MTLLYILFLRKTVYDIWPIRHIKDTLPNYLAKIMSNFKIININSFSASIFYYPLFGSW